MQFDQGPQRLGYRGSVGSRAGDVLVKVVAVTAGIVLLMSAFVLSLVFFAVAFTVVLVAGGYLWWKTRDLRKQMRAQMQEQMQPRRSDDDVIEGVVIHKTEATVRAD